MYLRKIIFALFLALSPFLAHAQEAIEQLPDEFFKVRVLQIQEEGEMESELGGVNPYQKLQLEILSGSQKGNIVELTHGGNFSLQESQKVKEGQKLTLTKSYPYNGIYYYISDFYRLDKVIYFALGFFGLVFILATWRGLASIFGLGISLLVIIKWTLPQIMEGKNPFWVSFLSTVAIAVSTLYMAHGFKKRTTLALVGILLTVLIALLMAVFSVQWIGLEGTGSEEAFNLQLSNLPNLNLKGLLLGGMIIGTLGVLDDVATTQVATVEELHKVNPNLTLKELYSKGMSVGKEHIISIINTLVLAYAGGSLALLINFNLSSHLPLWVMLNNEGILEEIMRTLVGSTALLFAVPITTLLAAYGFGRKMQKI